MLRELRILGVVAVLAISARAESEFVPIFDGQSLEGWEGDTRFWRVEDGAIVGETTPERPAERNTFLIWGGGEVADFELKIEFKIDAHNSGIQYRSRRLGDQSWEVAGYQADMTADHQLTGTAYGENYKKLLADRGEKTVVGKRPDSRRVVAQVGDSDEILAHLNPDGWNEYHIIALGNQCLQMINGVVTAEFSESTEKRLRSGLIALQVHAAAPMKVQFRNIQLRKLDAQDKKKVLFLAGKGSHGYGAHEHQAGCLLLARCLNESEQDVIAQVATEGDWPEPWAGYDRPDTVVMYCDGYAGHLAKDHQDKIQRLVDEGIGVACLHFGVEVKKEQLGAQFLDWIGGYFENGWSVNPIWTPVFEPMPEHPICNGVQPFTLRDEWYYHMRFRPNFENTTAILSAKPPLKTLKRKGSRGTNPTVQAAVEAGVPQVVAWAYERPNGGRGFGFTGGHYHENWTEDEFRKLVLNALLWTAGGVVPPEGMASRPPSKIDMELNQDYEKPKRLK